MVAEKPTFQVGNQWKPAPQGEEGDDKVRWKAALSEGPEVLGSGGATVMYQQFKWKGRLKEHKHKAEGGSKSWCGADSSEAVITIL